MDCSICLSALKSPVALPCGHLHCSGCLTDYIDKSSNAMHSKCPTCRAKFSLVTPDLALVPQKYHPFISSAVRRIYIDTDANTNTNTNNDTEGTDENLNVEIVRQAEEISHFHRRVITLERENAMLMDSAEANIRRAQACAEGERRAILERDEERGKIATLVQKMQKMEKELEKQIRLASLARSSCTSSTSSSASTSTSTLTSMPRSSTWLAPRPTPRLVAAAGTGKDRDEMRIKRARLATALPTEDPSESAPASESRPIKPLPRRSGPGLGASASTSSPASSSPSASPRSGVELQQQRRNSTRGFGFSSSRFLRADRPSTCTPTRPTIVGNMRPAIRPTRPMYEGRRRYSAQLDADADYDDILQGSIAEQ